MKKKGLIAATGLLAAAMLLAGCGQAQPPETASAAGEASQAVSAAAEIPGGDASVLSETMDLQSARAVIQGFEWGPAVSKIIVDCGQEAEAVDAGTLKVTTSAGGEWSERQVLSAYLCDSQGNAVSEESSSYIAAELSVDSVTSLPFQVDFENYFQISWADYGVRLEVNPRMEWTVGGTAYGEGSAWEYTFAEEDRILPDSAAFETDAFTYEPQDIVLKRAWYAPEGTDGQEPLLIWLHEGGEGGDDIQYALLGTEATALAREEIQSYFVSEESAGAWVLLIQTPTYWMDETGQRQENRYLHGGKQESYYTEALFAAISDFVETHPEIDQNRIYLGGASNGGYMTLNLMFEHGDYFAAYFPVCESYLNGNISDEMVSGAADKNIWFVQAENDTIVDPRIAALPLYYRLAAAGADNIHFSLFPEVTGTDDPEGEYIGHYSWVYVFNDAVNRDFDLEQVRADAANIRISQEGDTRGNLVSKGNYVTAANCTEEANLFQWMAEQSLAD